MSSIHDLPLFIFSGLLLNLTPGPDVLYIAQRTAVRGWRGGVAASWGIAAGLGVHVVLAAAGVSALLAASAAAFTVLKWAGAAYLVYVGVQMWRQAGANGPAASVGSPATVEGEAFPALQRDFLQGFWTNVLNPKVRSSSWRSCPSSSSPMRRGRPCPSLCWAASSS